MSECRLFEGHLDPHGYGIQYVSHGEAEELGIPPGMYRSHRLAYTLKRGPIPQGLVIDHLCHGWDRACNSGRECQHRRCVNVDHMELVTVTENIQRGRSPDVGRFNREKTHCPAGHEYSPANTGWVQTPHLKRICKECRHVAAGSKRHWAKGSDHCVNGHLWTPEITYINAKGRRVCRDCKRIRYRRDHPRPTITL